MKLTETQLGELRRAFSVCDKEGAGYITRGEIAQLIKMLDRQAISSTPSEKEIDALMKLMDHNNDNKVTFEEFAAAISEWFEQDSLHTTNLKKRKRETEEVREEIHRKVTKFFLQFRQSNTFNETRANVESIFKKNYFSGDNNEIEMKELGEVSEEDKKTVLNHLKKVNLPDIISKFLSATSVPDAAPHMHDALKVLRILLFYPTPSDRREIADDLVNIFKAFVLALARIVKMLSYDEYPKAQFDALRILIYLIPGPRIASTPEEHIFHDSKMYFKEELKKLNFVPQLVKLLGSPYQEVRHRALTCVGLFASHHHEMRDYLLQHNVVKPIMSQFAGIFEKRNEPNIVVLRMGTWVVSILCGATSSVSPDWAKLKEFTPMLSQLMIYFGVHYEDFRSLAYICTSLSFLLPGLAEDNVSIKFVDFLKHKDSQVVSLAIKTINHLLMADENIAKNFLKYGFFKMAEVLLHHSDKHVVSNTLKCVATLCGLRGYVQDCIDAKIVPTLISIIREDPADRSKALKVVKYITRGSASQVRYLVTDKDCKIIQVLCHVLSFFKEQEDKVLQKVYGFKGSAYNFELVNDAVMSLNNILSAGEIEAESTKKLTNPYATYFDSNCIGALGALLQIIKKAPAAEVDAWRSESGHTLEERVKGVLIKIKEVADKHAKESKAASTISSQIQQQLALFYDHNVYDNSQKLIQQLMMQYKEAHISMMKFQAAVAASAPNTVNNQIVFNSLVDLKKQELETKKKLLQELHNQTNVDIGQLEKLFEWFKTKCNEFGRLGRSKFQQGLTEICNIKDPIMLDQCYKSFDKDGDGEIDFREFVVCLTAIYKQRAEQQKQEQILRVMFKTYDMDNNGGITIDEVFQIFKSVREAQGIPYTEQSLRQVVEAVFKEVDINGDGMIDFQEFSLAVQQKKLPNFWS